MRRVVITGFGSVTAYGTGADPLWIGLKNRNSKVNYNSELEHISGLNSKICALVPPLNEKQIDRRYRKSMSRVGIFSAFAAHEAICNAKLDDDLLKNGRTGISFSNTVNSPSHLEQIFKDYFQDDKGIEKIRSKSFFKIMNHSCAANLAQYMSIRGRVISPAAACATSGQAIALGAEAIAFGLQDIMLCGGADEVHPLTIGTFDTLDAASTHYNQNPAKASRPFDKARDGVICSEGAAILVLETLNSAKNRNAEIFGEIIGWSMNSSKSLVSPDCDSIYNCILSSLQESGLKVHDIDYINAHATSTILGDTEEAGVLKQIFRDKVPVSSLKGHLGHTMAASGALEIIAILKMFEEQVILGTMNLENIDPTCAGLDLPKEDRKQTMDIVLKNNFAFGGINTALIIRRFA